MGVLNSQLVMNGQMDRWTSSRWMLLQLAKIGNLQNCLPSLYPHPTMVYGGGYLGTGYCVLVLGKVLDIDIRAPDVCLTVFGRAWVLVKELGA